MVRENKVVNLPKTGSILRRLLIIVPVVLALTLISLFLPARQVTIKGIGRLSFETTVTLSVGSQVAYASPATLYEYYNTGDDFSGYVRGANWSAQTFTPSVAHKITSVKLKLYRLGNPGTVTVSIKATDGSGHPTGTDLCSGTIDGNTLTPTSPGLWYEITLGAGYNLAANTKYAIVVRATAGSSGNEVEWRADSSSPAYASGNCELSTNSGSSWTRYTAYDYMFEEWGEVPDISNAPSSKAFGSVSENSSYWSTATNPPNWSNGLDDAECYFTVTNNSSGAVNISIKATNFGGGVGWTLASSPGVNIVTLKAGKSGDALETNMVILTTSNQSFITSLAASGTKKWEIKLETPTSFTDGVQKSSMITLTATAS